LLESQDGFLLVPEGKLSPTGFVSGRKKGMTWKTLESAGEGYVLLAKKKKGD